MKTKHAREKAGSHRQRFFSFSIPPAKVNYPEGEYATVPAETLPPDQALAKA